MQPAKSIENKDVRKTVLKHSDETKGQDGLVSSPDVDGVKNEECRFQA